MSTLIPCEVDTTPMAAEIQSVSNQVRGTTAAVVTMQSAVVAAEVQSANRVCSNVNRGFFTLVQSQISQKIANKQSRVEALLMQLGQQKRRLISIKSNMEHEYGRIAERYLKIFTSVNKELEQRIRQVDQPVFELVNKHMATSTNRMNALSSWVMTSQAEGIEQSQQILVSKMKHNTQVALEQSQNFLVQIGDQRVLTEKILISNPKGNEEKTCQIPIMISETINDPMGVSRTVISTPEGLSTNNASQIFNMVGDADKLPWKQSEKDASISEEFGRILDASKVSPRVKDLIKKMYTSADFETL
jgi:hypothetical protein